MLIRHVLLVAALVFSLVGCFAHYQTTNLSGVNGKLDRQKTVYVAVPQDGAYGSQVYRGSGQTVTRAVAAAFSREAQKVRSASKSLAVDKTLELAKAQGAGYAVVPVIAHWEHRATEWSGLPSRMTIQLSILDVATGEQVQSTMIEGRSRVVSWTSTSPESLLREPLAQYVGSIY